MKRNDFLTFLFSLIPGAGQMYQGYMKRGLSLILLFVLPIMIGSSMIPVLMALAAVVYMYSFFDSLNLHAQLKGADGEKEAPEDNFLVHMDWLEGGDLKRLTAGKHHLLGWGCVALGVAALYQSVLRPFLSRLINMIPNEAIYNALNGFLYHVPNLVIALVFIYVGLWLIRGPKKKAEDDFEAYRGDEEDE